VLLGGYEQAVERFGEASRTRDPVRVFAPLFEALNLAVVLDDQAREHWAPEGVPLGWSWRTRVEGGDSVSAIRFVRNRVHHQWADALTLSDGFSSPLVAPLVSHEWRWRRLVDLPEADTPGAKNAADAEADYEHLLATTHLRASLSEDFSCRSAGSPTCWSRLDPAELDDPRALPSNFRGPDTGCADQPSATGTSCQGTR
jgi:hypothetical protein